MWEIITQNEEDMKENMVSDSVCILHMYVLITLYFYIGRKCQYSHHINKETYSTRSRILCLVLEPSFKTLYPDDKKPFNSHLFCLLAAPCQWEGTITSIRCNSYCDSTHSYYIRSYWICGGLVVLLDKTCILANSNPWLSVCTRVTAVILCVCYCTSCIPQ